VTGRTEERPTVAAAGWMARRLRRDGMLPRFYAAEVVRRHFGQALVYEDDSGLLAVRGDVVREFLRAAGAPVGWDARRRFWYVEQEPRLASADPNETLPHIAA
jgi:hypothetical protein